MLFFDFGEYEFCFFDNFGEMCDVIWWKDVEVGFLCFVVGYVWDWVLKKDLDVFDIEFDGEWM